MKVKTKVEGLREIEKALDDLGKKATAKSVMVRAMRTSTKPLADTMKQLVPVRTGGLRDSIAISTKLTRTQKKKYNQFFKVSGNQRSLSEVFVGPSYTLGKGGRHGHLVEFGTVKTSPQPFARPAWAATQVKVLNGIKSELWTEIDKAAARIAKRRAKAAKG